MLYKTMMTRSGKSSLLKWVLASLQRHAERKLQNCGEDMILRAFGPHSSFLILEEPLDKFGLASLTKPSSHTVSTEPQVWAQEFQPTLTAALYLMSFDSLPEDAGCEVTSSVRRAISAVCGSPHYTLSHPGPFSIGTLLTLPTTYKESAPEWVAKTTPITARSTRFESPAMHGCL